MKPVHIFINGEELIGYTDMTLSRSKDDLTGELSISIFMGYVPSSPTLMNATRGKEVLVYIGGHLAFTGMMDKRLGTGTYSGDNGSASLSVGPNEYSVKLTARGKTKYLIDSSHQHPTTNMLKPTTQEAFKKLVEPWGIQLEWLGSEIKLDKLRFRDGARVVDEIQRLATENGYFVYETRDGNLRVTDDTGRTTGEPIVLGTNILSFQAEQAEDKAKSRIKVKGQRIEKAVWGEDAILKTVKEVQDEWVGAEIPIIVQHYGDATPEALERRAQFEANKRSSLSKQVTVDLFHVQSTSGEPWDIGQLHYVEIPPEGLFDVLECTKLTYTVQNDQTLTTSMTLSPPPSSAASHGGGGPTANLPEIVNDLYQMGSSRRAAAGVTFAPGQYPSPWSGPVLSILQFIPFAGIFQEERELFSEISGKASPPKSLPPGYKSEGEK